MQINSINAKTLKSPVDIDLVAHWFDCDVARNALIMPVESDATLGSFFISFEVLCFTVSGSKFWSPCESSPLPVTTHSEAVALARVLDIID